MGGAVVWLWPWSRRELQPPSPSPVRMQESKKQERGTTVSAESSWLKGAVKIGSGGEVVFIREARLFSQSLSCVAASS